MWWEIWKQLCIWSYAWAEHLCYENNSTLFWMINNSGVISIARSCAFHALKRKKSFLCDQLSLFVLQLQYTVRSRINQHVEVINSACECPVGMGPHSTCKHVCALLLALVKLKQDGEMNGMNYGCTDRLQSFHRPAKKYGGNNYFLFHSIGAGHSSQKHFLTWNKPVHNILLDMLMCRGIIYYPDMQLYNRICVDFRFPSENRATSWSAEIWPLWSSTSSCQTESRRIWCHEEFGDKLSRSYR